MLCLISWLCLLLPAAGQGLFGISLNRDATKNGNIAPTEVGADGTLQKKSGYPDNIGYVADLGPSFVRNMWTTPIIVTSLLGGSSNSIYPGDKIPIKKDISQDSPISQTFLENLAKSVTDDFNKFRGNKTAVNFYRNLFDLHEDALDSDVYFFAQQAVVQIDDTLSAYNSRYCTDMALYDPIIVSIFYSAIYEYLKEARVPDDVIESLPRDRKSLRIWASIHSDGSFHDAHSHANSAISGVLYLKTPPGSGSLFFEDPRGRLPPFGHVLRLKPEVGDLVLFPGWLLHGVQPTLSKDMRISLSFNFDVSWELTNDINYMYTTKDYGESG